jgi:hypothetical protein
MRRVVRGAALTACLVLVIPPRLWAGYPCYGQAYYPPVTYSQPYYPPVQYVQQNYVTKEVYKEKLVVEKEPVILPTVLQEVLAPAYVFQVMSAFQPPTPASGIYPAGQSSYGFGQTATSPAPLPPPPAAPAPAPQPPPSQPPAAPAPPPAAPATVRLDEAQLTRLAALVRGDGSDQVPSLGDVLVKEEVPSLGAGQQPAYGGAAPSAGEQEAIGYFRTACVSCHQQGAKRLQGNKVNLFAPDGSWRPSRTDGQPVTRKQIHDYVAAGECPPEQDGVPGTKVPPQVLQAIKHWGAPAAPTLGVLPAARALSRRARGSSSPLKTDEVDSAGGSSKIVYAGRR